MEKLTFDYSGGTATGTGRTPVLVGVVGSGNLEILIEPADLGGHCEISILTAARGFATIWKAVVDDFHARHGLSDVRVSINDVGATPAVVALRLDQAVEDFLGGRA